MNPKDSALTLRKVTFYLLFALLGLFLAGLLPQESLAKQALADAVASLFIVLPVLLEGRALPSPLLLPKAPLFSLPFFFLLPLLTLSTAFFWSHVVPPQAEPSAPPLWYAIVFSALLPALVEELLFRHFLLRTLRTRNGGGAVLFSALFFSLLHANFYQMPYAFLAGLLLGAVALATDSFLLPFALHLCNNLCSLLLAPALSLPLLCALLGLGLLLSLLLVLFLAKRRAFPLLPPALSQALADKAGRRALFCDALHSPLWLFLGITLLLAFLKG